MSVFWKSDSVFDLEPYNVKIRIPCILGLAGQCQYRCTTE